MNIDLNDHFCCDWFKHDSLSLFINSMLKLNLRFKTTIEPGTSSFLTLVRGMDLGLITEPSPSLLSLKFCRLIGFEISHHLLNQNLQTHKLRTCLYMFFLCPFPECILGIEFFDHRCLSIGIKTTLDPGRVSKVFFT